MLTNGSKRAIAMWTLLLLGIAAGPWATDQSKRDAKASDSTRSQYAAVSNGTVSPATAPVKAAPGQPAVEQETFPNISVSGFMDIAGSYRSSAGDRSNLFLYEAEVDMVIAQSDRVTLSASAAYLPSDDKVNVCLATVGLQVLKSDRGFLTDATVTAGLFNPRFGIDYQCNASSTRKLATAPLAVQFTHQNWLDAGAEAFFSGPRANLAVFAVNGFTPSDSVMQDAISLVTGLGDTIDPTPTNAFGGRLGLTPVEGLELGGSMAAGYNQSDEIEMVMYGGDIHFTRSIFDLRGEYILHSINRSILRQDNKGYYVQPMLTIGRVFATCRYDAFKVEGHGEATQTSVGGGYMLASGLELRLESIFADNSDNNQTIMQLFASF
ncbi:MAG: hypothetical protein HY851_01880 [candidate division Zixibacteria bacterium]|nr:hypothetical protein [candidate division Zixibacteria bacterium]